MPPAIVIAEDDPNIVLSLEFLLRQAGYDVRAVNDGEAALAAVRQAPPDLVLLDVMMPKLGGFEVCREIRRDPRLSGVKVVMLTAKSRDRERAEGTAAGADAYVIKPFSTRDMVQQIADLLAGPRH
jgi:two-component system, OmpR family, alkaline phosphatase synthesis response regulator PhoP